MTSGRGDSFTRSTVSRTSSPDPGPRTRGWSRSGRRRPGVRCARRSCRWRRPKGSTSSRCGRSCRPSRRSTGRRWRGARVVRPREQSIDRDRCACTSASRAVRSPGRLDGRRPEGVRGPLAVGALHHPALRPGPRCRHPALLRRGHDPIRGPGEQRHAGDLHRAVLVRAPMSPTRSRCRRSRGSSGSSRRCSGSPSRSTR